MFSGILIPADFVDRMHSGKYLIAGTYNNLTVRAREMVRDLVFYRRVRTNYVGKLQERLSLFNRDLSPNHPPLAYWDNETDFVVENNVFEHEGILVIPQVRLQLEEGLSEGRMVLDFVSTSAEYELGRATIVVEFKPTTVKLL